MWFIQHARTLHRLVQYCQIIVREKKKVEIRLLPAALQEREQDLDLKEDSALWTQVKTELFCTPLLDDSLKICKETEEINGARIEFAVIKENKKNWRDTAFRFLTLGITLPRSRWQLLAKFIN